MKTDNALKTLFSWKAAVTDKSFISPHMDRPLLLSAMRPSSDAGS